MGLIKINYKNIDLSFIDKGKGSSLIFLHGFLENATMWNYYTESLSKKYRVISIDLLGHGKTDCIGYIHSMEDMADAVFAVISHLNLKKVTFIGHSMGGYVALAFGELYPDFVKKIILVASTTRSDSSTRIQNRDRAIDIIKKNSDLFVKMAVGNQFQLQTRKSKVNEIEEHLNNALATPVQGIVAALEGMKTRTDREVLLHFAPYPIQFILGEKDPVMVYDDIITQIDNKQKDLITLDGGHMLHIEAKEELLTAIKTFLK
ncbi:alpha/beta fold hydrolase [Myroides phaeus]|uniref:Pimeloyl-ACP methyl ester carboxylesterase n=1 Tax=Myroides phaeus TaxID=702745 RepID=A0A1G8G958_9FLAO|nr:alpha/beta hydrolase [Myroides phaeus]MEC4116526.1 alpha/beta hydrolase [Myroides phaeus]SDH90925.1 Pimeloyl-ACP methyl ester carboxylesterase [Myroides phaeus]